MRKLAVTNLRGIRSLDFPLPEKDGVYLLTGANGSGKSTVLSCLARLGDPEALDRFFTMGIRFSDSRAGNVFADSRIRFVSGKNEAEFRFRQDRWQCTDPRKMEAVLADFGYPRIVFTESRTKYQPPKEENFSIKDVVRAPDAVSSVAAEVFEDSKFHHLYQIRSEAAGRDLFLIHQFTGGEDFFFSENNFSAGERALLRLAVLLPALEPGSLVLIDETEMALHPKAQRRLLEYLIREARPRHLTILVSTQSASLIKITDPRRILLLENDEYGNMQCRTDVYPAAVLGEMAFAEEILPETILLVEDQEASFLLEAIVEKLKTGVEHDLPYCKILPVGGYMQVVILLDNLEKVFPPYVKRRAVLDQDAEPFIRKAIQEPSRPHFDVVVRNRKRIYFLPCAPEQGVILLLEDDLNGHTRGLSKVFGQSIRLSDIMYSNPYREIGGTARSECKDKLSVIVYAIRRLTGESDYMIRKKLYRYYADNRYKDIRELKADYCSLVFRR